MLLPKSPRILLGTRRFADFFWGMLRASGVMSGRDLCSHLCDTVSVPDSERCEAIKNISRSISSFERIRIIREGPKYRR